MPQLQLTALATALAVAATAPALAAQDTAGAARARPDTSAYVPGAGVDTSARPGRDGTRDTMVGMTDTMAGGNADTMGEARSQGGVRDMADTAVGDRADSAGMGRADSPARSAGAPDSTKAGDRRTRKPRTRERRMHPGDDGVGTSRSLRRSGVTADTSGMPGRHRADTTLPGATHGRTGAPSSTSGTRPDSASAGSARVTDTTGMVPQPTRQPSQSTSGTAPGDSGR